MLMLDLYTCLVHVDSKFWVSCLLSKYIVQTLRVRTLLLVSACVVSYEQPDTHELCYTSSMIYTTKQNIPHESVQKSKIHWGILKSVSSMKRKVLFEISKPERICHS